MMIQVPLISMSIQAMLPIRNEPGMAILLFMQVDVVQRPCFSLCSCNLRMPSKPGLLFFFIRATFTEARMLSFPLPGDGQNTPIGFKDALMQFYLDNCSQDAFLTPGIGRARDLKRPKSCGTSREVRMVEALGVVDDNTHRLKRPVWAPHDSCRSLFRPAELKAGHQTARAIFFWADHLHISSAV